MRLTLQASLLGAVLMTSCGLGPKPPARAISGMGSLSDRLNQSHGYEVDGQGNWVPRNNKRSQYEGRGDTAQFGGNFKQHAFQTEQLSKGAWLTNPQQMQRPTHHLDGSKSSLKNLNHQQGQRAHLSRDLKTPAKIAGNHIPGQSAHETGGRRIDKPADAETEVRRRVFGKPDIIGYQQQRELSIQESKQLLGREN